MATTRWFLKLDGIAGESTATDHKGELDVLSFSWGVSHPGTAQTGGGGGKPSFQDLQVVTPISIASPKLFLACATGKHLKSATLVGARHLGKGKEPIALEITMEDILVTAVMEATDPDAPLTEQISFSYAKIVMTYTPVTSSGASGSPVTAGFDIKANKKV